MTFVTGHSELLSMGDIGRTEDQSSEAQLKRKNSLSLGERVKV